MALPQIKEAEPWLEEDLAELETKSQKLNTENEPEALEHLSKRLSFVSSVTAISKISIYSYLILKMLSKSGLPKLLLKALGHFAKKYKSLSSIILILLLAFCKHLSAVN